MDIKIVHLIMYVALITVTIYCFCIRHNNKKRWVSWVQKHLSLIVLLMVTNTISFGLSLRNQQQDYYIKRQPENGQERQYSFEAHFGEDGGYDEDKLGFDLSVSPKRFKPKEAEEKMSQAFAYIDEHLKGENKTLEHVTRDLDISIDYERFPFDMEVRPADYSLMDEEGVLRNEEEQLMAAGYDSKDIISGISTEVNIRLYYEDMEEEKDYSLVIYPREKSDAERLLSEIQKMYSRKEQESIYEDEFMLPASYKDIEIESMEKSGVRPESILVMGIVLTVLLVLREVEQNKTEEARERQELLQSYPWFINELVLLLGAGMQVRNVFSVLIEDYERSAAKDHRDTLIRELKRSKHDFEIGMSEGKIYYELGRRIKLPCYIKVLTLLEQNVTKGSKGLVAVLEQEERGALEERMNLAKKRGEEAGTKLLGPMILLLLIVMMMIMVPAFLSFA